MIFKSTAIPGVWIIEIQKHSDPRGFFARSWCRREFEAHGLNADMVQVNVGFSENKGTARGLHFQEPPWSEAKFVRCTRGAIYDVVVDLRTDSPTHKKWIAVELTGDNHRMLYVPEGCAQGYQTLIDETEMCYQTTQFYAPEFAHGVRFDDPAFGVSWPEVVSCISDVDRAWPLYTL